MMGIYRPTETSLGIGVNVAKLGGSYHRIGSAKGDVAAHWGCNPYHCGRLHRLPFRAEARLGGLKPVLQP
jgi:hypothetical protein